VPSDAKFTDTTYTDATISTSGLMSAADKTNLDMVYSKVPSQTYTSGNELADKTFVNSSIATNTANFLGTLDVVADLGLFYGAATSAVVSALNSHTFSATKTNNDYTFVINKDSSNHFIYQRYKWVTDNSTFAYEYTLNNSSFTANQWSAINSGITAVLLSSYNTHLNNNNIHITYTERTTWNNKQDYISDLTNIRTGARLGLTALQDHAL